MTSPRGDIPRLLLVTPEIAYLPAGMAARARRIRIGSGKQAQTSAALMTSLYQHGADIHLALPNYRLAFYGGGRAASAGESRLSPAPGSDRVHLAQDRHFYYQRPDACDRMVNDLKASLVFQREVINHIVPVVQPDLIHCMGWMTGLLPAMARERGIACVFSIHDFHTRKVCLRAVEDRGIDAAGFWRHLYYDAYPQTYETVRATIPVDLLASGMFASQWVTVDDPKRLREIIRGRFPGVARDLKIILTNKWESGSALGIGNSAAGLHRPPRGRRAALAAPFTDDPAVNQYMTLYEKILQQPLGSRLPQAAFRRPLADRIGDGALFAPAAIHLPESSIGAGL